MHLTGKACQMSTNSPKWFFLLATSARLCVWVSTEESRPVKWKCIASTGNNSVRWPNDNWYDTKARAAQTIESIICMIYWQSKLSKHTWQRLRIMARKSKSRLQVIECNIIWKAYSQVWWRQTLNKTFQASTKQWKTLETWFVRRTSSQIWDEGSI